MALRSGTVTFLFTDVEGSTALAERLRSAWPAMLADHRRLLTEAVLAAGGEEVDVRGEEMLAAFATARAAVEAALAAQRAHARHPWPEGGVVRVRMGIHTGEPTVADAGYLGLDVHRGARICALAHGGQVLLSQTTRDLAPNEQVRDLGEVALKGLSLPERVFQLLAPDLADGFPDLREPAKPPGVVGRERELVAAARQRLRGLRIRRGSAPGLAELGWEVRRLLPTSASPLRDELALLAGDLLAAGRSAGDADVFLDEVDRSVLLKRQTEHRELAVVSRQAQREVEAITRRLLELEQLVARRRDLDAVAVAVRNELPAPPDVSELRLRIAEATARLDETLAVVREEIGESAPHLRRTRTRGVYKVGNSYVVPFFDSVGVERPRRFETASDARAFKRAQRLQEKRQRDYTGPRMPPPEAGGGIGGGI
jgi:class 3 adenylate cyclase